MTLLVVEPISIECRMTKIKVFHNCQSELWKISEGTNEQSK